MSKHFERRRNTGRHSNYDSPWMSHQEPWKWRGANEPSWNRRTNNHRKLRDRTRHSSNYSRTKVDESDERDAKTQEEKRRSSNLLLTKLQALTAEDKSCSMQQLLSDQDTPISDKKVAIASDESKRIAHVPKPKVLQIPSVIPPPPSLPMGLFPFLENVEQDEEEIEEDTSVSNDLQDKIKRNLFHDLLSMPHHDLKRMVTCPKSRRDHLFFSHLRKTTRSTISRAMRNLAEHKLKSCDDHDSNILTELETLVDADIAVDVCRMPVETIQVLSDLFNLDLEPNSQIHLEIPTMEVNAFQLEDVKVSPDALFYSNSAPTIPLPSLEKLMNCRSSVDPQTPPPPPLQVNAFQMEDVKVSPEALLFPNFAPTTSLPSLKKQLVDPQTPPPPPLQVNDFQLEDVKVSPEALLFPNSAPTTPLPTTQLPSLEKLMNCRSSIGPKTPPPPPPPHVNTFQLDEVKAPHEALLFPNSAPTTLHPSLEKLLNCRSSIGPKTPPLPPLQVNTFQLEDVKVPHEAFLFPNSASTTPLPSLEKLKNCRSSIGPKTPPLPQISSPGQLISSSSSPLLLNTCTASTPMTDPVLTNSSVLHQESSDGANKILSSIISSIEGLKKNVMEKLIVPPKPETENATTLSLCKHEAIEQIVETQNQTILVSTKQSRPKSTLKDKCFRSKTCQCKSYLEHRKCETNFKKDEAFSSSSDQKPDLRKKLTLSDKLKNMNTRAHIRSGNNEKEEQLRAYERKQKAKLIAETSTQVVSYLPKSVHVQATTTSKTSYCQVSPQSFPKQTQTTILKRHAESQTQVSSLQSEMLSKGTCTELINDPITPSTSTCDKGEQVNRLFFTTNRHSQTQIPLKTDLNQSVKTSSNTLKPTGKCPNCSQAKNLGEEKSAVSKNLDKQKTNSAKLSLDTEADPMQTMAMGTQITGDVLLNEFQLFKKEVLALAAGSVIRRVLVNNMAGIMTSAFNNLYGIFSALEPHSLPLKPKAEHRSKTAGSDLVNSGPASSSTEKNEPKKPGTLLAKKRVEPGNINHFNEKPTANSLKLTELSNGNSRNNEKHRKSVTKCKVKRDASPLTLTNNPFNGKVLNCKKPPRPTTNHSSTTCDKESQSKENVKSCSPSKEGHVPKTKANKRKLVETRDSENTDITTKPSKLHKMDNLSLAKDEISTKDDIKNIRVKKTTVSKDFVDSISGTNTDTNKETGIFDEKSTKDEKVVEPVSPTPFAINNQRAFIVNKLKKKRKKLKSDSHGNERKRIEKRRLSLLEQLKVSDTSSDSNSDPETTEGQNGDDQKPLGGEVIKSLIRNLPECFVLLDNKDLNSWLAKKSFGSISSEEDESSMVVDSAKGETLIDDFLLEESFPNDLELKRDESLEDAKFETGETSAVVENTSDSCTKQGEHASEKENYLLNEDKADVDNLEVKSKSVEDFTDESNSLVPQNEYEEPEEDGSDYGGETESETSGEPIDTLKQWTADNYSDASDKSNELKDKIILTSHEFSGFQGDIFYIQVNGNHLYAGGADQFVHCFSLRTGKRKRVYGGQGGSVKCVAITRGARSHCLYVASSDGHVRSFSAKKSSMLKCSPKLDGSPTAIEVIDNRMFVGLCTGEVLQLNLKNLKVAKRYNIGHGAVLALCIGSVLDSLVMIAATADGLLIVKDVKTGLLEQKLSWNYESPAHCLRLQNEKLYCTSQLSHLVIFKLGSEVSKEPHVVEMRNPIKQLSIEDKSLLAATANGDIFILDQNGVVLDSFTKSGELISCDIYKKKIFIACYKGGKLCASPLPQRIRMLF